MRPPFVEQSSPVSFSGRVDAIPHSTGAASSRLTFHPVRSRAERRAHLFVVTAAGGLLSYADSGATSLYNFARTGNTVPISQSIRPDGTALIFPDADHKDRIYYLDYNSLGTSCYVDWEASQGREREGNSRQPLSEGLRSNSNGAFPAKGKEALRAAAQRWRQPSDSGDRHSKSHKEEGLPTSLFAPFRGELPVDGKTLTDREEFCDPMERNCQTPMHVWESKCTACYGSGTVSFSSRRGRRSSATCASCTGMGYVRRTSSRLIPDLNRNGNHMTIGRPIALDEEEYEEYMRSLKNGKKK